MFESIATAVMGAVIGVISAFLGLGGGILIVPILPEIADVTAKEAVATSLFTIFLVVSNNCIGFHKKNLVKWNIALIVGPMTAVGAFTSGKLTALLSDGVLRAFLAVLVTVFLIRAFLKKRGKTIHHTRPFSGKTLGITSGIGVLAGLLSGISGIGAGLVVSPLLINLHLAENEKVSPTANGVMVFTTFFGALAFVDLGLEFEGWKLGFLHLDKALLLAATAFSTSFIARKYQHRMPVIWRKGLLTTLLALLALKMWWEVYGHYS